MGLVELFITASSNNRGLPRAGTNETGMIRHKHSGNEPDYVGFPEMEKDENGKIIFSCPKCREKLE